MIQSPDDDPRLCDALAEMQRLQREFPDHIVFATAHGDALETWTSKNKTRANRLADEGQFVVLLDGSRLWPAASVKRCCECHTFKGLDDFATAPSNGRDGRSNRCHVCTAERMRKYSAGYRSRNREQPSPRIGKKRCPGCGETKAKKAFSRKAAAADGLQAYCHECQNARRRKP